MHLYDDIGDAPSSLRGSKSSFVRDLSKFVSQNIVQINTLLSEFFFVVFFGT